MKPDMIYGLFQDDSEQGLGQLLLNNYPQREQKLEAQLAIKSKKQQKTYSKSCWHRFIEKELEKLYQYDYDITFQRCPEVCGLSEAKKYRKIATVCYQCECGSRWENRYQKVVFYFEFISEQSYIEQSLRKMRQTGKITKKSLNFGQSLAKELKNLIDLTIYPYFLKYELTIEDKKCEKCKKMAVARLQKSKISALSKLFCRQVCQVLSKQIQTLGKADAKKQ